MIRRKVCLLGSFAVGKTSLVRRFLHGIFDDRYLTTIGVRIDKKLVSLPPDGPTGVDGPGRPAREVTLVVWDIHGEDDFQKVRASHLRGAAGLIFVVDGTRRGTLDTALELEQRVRAEIGDVPSLLLLNKSDLRDAWELEPAEVLARSEGRWDPVVTSALTGDGVEAAFQRLAAETVRGLE